ncbi:hypothetical protein V5799_014498 [Amblyomma americanum]|uniref:Armadillo repeat-containing domain-containing protein n=1 Tax=Amblyomma americanum TaxID=6943 RepID=A0AAQ4E2V4_AMBAM
MASEDVAVKRVALCSAVFAGFAYVGYSILKSAFCFKGNGRDDKGSRKLVKLKKKKKHKGEQAEHDMSHRSSQTDLSVPPEDYITNSPAELHFIPKSVRNKVRELNLKARMFDDQYFARIFKPRSLQNSPWGSPKALSPVADGSCNNSYLSRSAENVHTSPTSPLKRKNSSRSSSRASQHWQCNDLSANHITEKSLYCAVVKETDELLQEVLHGLYNKARVMTLYEAKCLMTLLTSRNEDILVKTLTTMSNCAAFTINQDYLCDVGCLPLLKDLLDHDCLAVQVAATQAIANMAVNERNQTLLQPCIPLLLSAAVSRDGGCYLQMVSLLCLTNLALCDDTHEAFRGRLHHLCILVETADDAVRLQTLKLLVNLSCNSRMVPFLLAAKAPQNLFSLLEDSNREVTLRVLTYLANIVSCAAKKKLSLLDLPSEYRAAAPETLYAALWGAPSKEHLQAKTRTLVLRADEDISFQAGRIFEALTR